MELLATYGDDGDKSDSPGHSSDVGEKDEGRHSDVYWTREDNSAFDFMNKDASPPSVRAPSFTPYLQAEWESFEKMIGGGGEGESQAEMMTSNAQMFAPIPPVADFSNGSSASQKIHRRKSDDNTLVNETYLHSQSSSSSSSSSPLHGSLSPSTSHSSSSSRSSSLDRAKDSKRLNAEVINVASRSPSESIEPRSSSTSPVGVIQESSDRQSDSDSPGHSSASRSRSNSTDRESQDRSPEQHELQQQQRQATNPRSRSRSQSRSHRRSRSRSRSSRHRKRKHSHKSRSQSRNRKHRGSKTPHKKIKHRRRSRSRETQRSREQRRSRSRDRFGRTMRGRDSYRERSPASTRRRSRSRERSRERESHRNVQRDYSRRDGGSGRSKEKPLNFKEQMRQELIKASKMLNESSASNLTELMEDKNIFGLVLSEPSSDQPNNLTLNRTVLTNLAAATQNSTVTPQVALLQTMAAMHKKAQEITGIAVPKYYNPAAVNPLKYAEQVQKRKLLWSRPTKEKKEGGPENQWQGTHFSTDQDGKMAAKFRKLMGMKTGEAENTKKVGEERRKQQEELFGRLDKEYEFARMATHTHRGVGLGFQSQSFYPH